jgi:hypothetical protein
MSSLNEGFELDDELLEVNSSNESIITDGEELKSIQPSDFSQTVFDKVIPGKVPELSDTVAVATAVSKVEDLNDLRISITNASGMNRQFALEVEQLIPGFINDDKPISFYTEFPSKTNYKFALETIVEEQKNLVNSIRKSVMELVKTEDSKSKTISLESKEGIMSIDDVIKSYSDKETCSILKRVRKILLDF